MCSADSGTSAGRTTTASQDRHLNSVPTTSCGKDTSFVKCNSLIAFAFIWTPRLILTTSNVFHTQPQPLPCRATRPSGSRLPKSVLVTEHKEKSFVLPNFDHLINSEFPFLKRSNVHIHFHDGLQVPAAPAAPAIPAPSDGPMSSEAVAALMAEKRRVNNERRKQQSARNAAIEARLEVNAPQ